jgi:hypothetical protein
VSKRKRAARAAHIARLYHVTDSVGELRRIRLGGRGEERGLMVLDEMGTLLNSRAWSSGDRAEMIEFFAQHRKLGWRVLIIAQDSEMVDKHLRLMIEQTIRLRNTRGFKRWGIPVIPFRIFVAMWTWEATGGRFVTKREVFRLGWWKNLYETTQIVAGEYAADDPDAIVLPRPPLTGTAGRESRPGAERSAGGERLGRPSGVTVAGIDVGPPIIAAAPAATTPRRASSTQPSGSATAIPADNLTAPSQRRPAAPPSAGRDADASTTTDLRPVPLDALAASIASDGGDKLPAVNHPGNVERPPLDAATVPKLNGAASPHGPGTG